MWWMGSFPLVPEVLPPAGDLEQPRPWHPQEGGRAEALWKGSRRRGADRSVWCSCALASKPSSASTHPSGGSGADHVWAAGLVSTVILPPWELRSNVPPSYGAGTTPAPGKPCPGQGGEDRVPLAVLPCPVPGSTQVPSEVSVRQRETKSSRMQCGLGGMVAKGTPVTCSSLRSGPHLVVFGVHGVCGPGCPRLCRSWDLPEEFFPTVLWFALPGDQDRTCLCS